MSIAVAGIIGFVMPFLMNMDNKEEVKKEKEEISKPIKKESKDD